MSNPISVLFIHGSWPNQFSGLHQYFRRTGLANSWFLINESERCTNQYLSGFPEGVMSYVPHGDIGEGAYYFSEIVERNARNAVGVLRATRQIVESRPIDIIVAHGILGAPQMLIDEIRRPVVGYVEFPSFCHHGWDPLYPPDATQRYCGKYEEMLNNQLAIKCARIIAPSEHARRMFPESLRSNVVAQMEGFDIEEIFHGGTAAFDRQPGCTYIGFSANTLSSEKGLEHFIVVSQRLAQVNPMLRFVLVGADNGLSYGFEKMFLERREPRFESFREYLFAKHAVDPTLYIVTGRLDRQTFSSTLRAIDFFLYPLQYGSANWGLFELLLHGKVVIASNRCFIPEVITDGENGLMLPYDDLEAWVNLANRIAESPDEFRAIGMRATESMRRFNFETVATRYVAIFKDAIQRYEETQGT